MRPVGAPQHPVRKFLDHLARERDDVAIGVRLAVQRRRTGNRQALGTADLAPDVLVIVHEFEKAREFRTVDRLRHVRPAHVVDNDGRRQLGEEIRELGQVRRLEIDDDMPVVLDNALGDLFEFVHRREVDQPLDEIEAHAAHARLMQALQFRVGHVAPDGRDSARSALARKQGVDHRAVVGAMTSRLHDDVAIEAETVAQERTIAPCWRRKGCICARAHKGTRRPAQTHGNARRRLRAEAKSSACSAPRTSRASPWSSRTAR